MVRVSTPYTYCIKHVSSDKRYYGARYAKGCHPSDLFQSYFTSSKTIKKLILEDGIAAFSTEIRKTFNTAEACVSWETKVLRRLNVTYNKNWLNLMVNKSISQEEMTHIVFERYGYSHTLLVPEIKARSKLTMLEKYGVVNALENAEILRKMKQQYLQKTGVENPFQLKEVQNKCKQTNLNKYGVPHIMQSDVYKKKMKETNLKIFGVDSYAKLPEYRQYMREKRLNSEILTCPICDIQSRSIGMKRYHFENCTERPILCIETNIVFKNAILAAENIQGYDSSVGNIASMIRQACRKDNNFVYGYHWKYAVEETKSP